MLIGYARVSKADGSQLQDGSFEAARTRELADLMRAAGLPL